jgi:hypothetical protein
MGWQSNWAALETQRRDQLFFFATLSFPRESHPFGRYDFDNILQTNR